MKLKTLKKIINGISEKYDNSEILIARDGEWNGFNNLNDVDKMLYKKNVLMSKRTIILKNLENGETKKIIL